MRIECVGGGPASLYFALLMKSRDSGARYIVSERCKVDSQYGLGVTLGEDVLDYLRSNDTELAQEIERAGFRWDKQIVCFRGKEAAYGGNDVCNISRQRLRKSCGPRSQSGCESRWTPGAEPGREPPDADRIVAADGAGSRIRQAVGHFQTEIHEGSNKYIWLAATKVFNSFNYRFAQTQAGGYGHTPTVSAQN